MVYGGYGGYGGFGGYGGYGGLGGTPNVASGIYPPGSAYGRDQYMGISQEKPKGFLQGLFSGTWDGIKKMFTTLPGILTTVTAVGLTAATGGAALIPLGALAAGIGVFNAGKGLVNQDGQGFTKGLLLGLGGLLALRFAPREILMGGRTFLLGGSDTATLGLAGRLKALWGGNHFVASNGDKLNWLQMSKDKIMGLFRPNAGSVQHLQELRTKGPQGWKTPQDAGDALRAGAPCPPGIDQFLRVDKQHARQIKDLTRQLEDRELAGKPTQKIKGEIDGLIFERENNFGGLKNKTMATPTEGPAGTRTPSDADSQSTYNTAKTSLTEAALSQHNARSTGTSPASSVSDWVDREIGSIDSELGSMPGSPGRARNLP